MVSGPPVYKNELQIGCGAELKEQALTKLRLDRVKDEHDWCGSNGGEARKIFARNNQSEILRSAQEVRRADLNDVYTCRSVLQSHDLDIVVRVGNVQAHWKLRVADDLYVVWLLHEEIQIVLQRSRRQVGVSNADTQHGRRRGETELKTKALAG